jgi:hypothetical protein
MARPILLVGFFSSVASRAVCFDNDFQSDVDSLFFLLAIEEASVQRPIQETNEKN